MLVCNVREAGPNWLEVTLGVADSGPGIARAAQRQVLRAFTTGVSRTLCSVMVTQHSFYSGRKEYVWDHVVLVKTSV